MELGGLTRLLKGALILPAAIWSLAGPPAIASETESFPEERVILVYNEPKDASEDIEKLRDKLMLSDVNTEMALFNGQHYLTARVGEGFADHFIRNLGFTTEEDFMRQNRDLTEFTSDELFNWVSYYVQETSDNLDDILKEARERDIKGFLIISNEEAYYLLGRGEPHLCYQILPIERVMELSLIYDVPQNDAQKLLDFFGIGQQRQEAGTSNTQFNFSLEEITQGGTLTFDELTQGKALVAPVWKRDCPMCKLQMPYVAGLYKALGEGIQFNGQTYNLENVNFMSICVATTRQNALSFVEEKGLEFPVLLEETGSLGGGYDGQGFPTTYVFAPGGNYIGWSDTAAPSYISEEIPTLLELSLSSGTSQQKRIDKFTTTTSNGRTIIQQRISVKPYEFPFWLKDIKKELSINNINAEPIIYAEGTEE